MARDYFVQRFCKFFKIHFILAALWFCLVSCEQYEPFENDIFSTSIPKGSLENNLLKPNFNGFTYRYCFTTPDNQEIGIEIIPWYADLDKLLYSYIDYHFPQERRKSCYSEFLNTFNWDSISGVDHEIYQDEDLLDGWCYAFHTLNGESVCVYTFARAGHCRSIKELITNLKVKSIPKPTQSSLWELSDKMIVNWIQEHYNNPEIYFSQPTNLVKPKRLFHMGGTECGILVTMNENMPNDILGHRLPYTLELDAHLRYIIKILDRHYLINFKFPDNTIEVPGIIDMYTY